MTMAARLRASWILVAGAALVAGSRWLGRRPAPDTGALRLVRAPLQGLLSVARPLVAELLLLRFEQHRERRELAGQLDDACAILALAPGRPARWRELAEHFIFDASAQQADLPARAASAKAGFDLLHDGLVLCDGHPLLRLSFGQSLLAIEVAQPELLGAIGVAGPDGAGAAELAAQSFEAGLAVATEESGVRDWLRFALVSLLCRELLAPEPRIDVAALRARSSRLLADPGLARASRERLMDALAARRAGAQGRGRRRLAGRKRALL